MKLLNYLPWRRKRIEEVTQALEELDKNRAYTVIDGVVVTLVWDGKHWALEYGQAKK